MKAPKDVRNTFSTSGDRSGAVSCRKKSARERIQKVFARRSTGRKIWAHGVLRSRGALGTPLGENSRRRYRGGAASAKKRQKNVEKSCPETYAVKIRFVFRTLELRPPFSRSVLHGPKLFDPWGSTENGKKRQTTSKNRARTFIYVRKCGLFFGC